MRTNFYNIVKWKRLARLSARPDDFMAPFQVLPVLHFVNLHIVPFPSYAFVSAKGFYHLRIISLSLGTVTSIIERKGLHTISHRSIIQAQRSRPRHPMASSRGIHYKRMDRHCKYSNRSKSRECRQDPSMLQNSHTGVSGLCLHRVMVRLLRMKAG